MSHDGHGIFNPELPPPPPEPPTIPLCVECERKANPAWGDGSLVYCRECAPPELKIPSQYLCESQ
jgi:hypothetical protein